MVIDDKIRPVEDHEELWDFLSRRLRKREFEVTLAHDGRQALESISQERPGIALLDMDLPIMDGWSVAHELRSRGDRLPIIAMTAHAMSGDREKALGTGCNAYHLELVDFAGLLAQIDQMLLTCANSRL